MSVLGAAAHKAYWHAQGVSGDAIALQWVISDKTARMWEDVAKAVTSLACPPADQRIKELEADLKAARDRLDVVSNGIAELLGMPYDTAGSTTVDNLAIAGLRKTAGLAYGTRREADEADAAYQAKAELDAARSERDL